MTPRWLKALYVTLGFASMAIGLIGLLIPLFPTAPFLILAAFFFSKGSRRLHAWMLSRPVIGPMIIEWRDHRVIRPMAKIMATIAIVLMFSLILYFVRVPIWVKIAIAILGIGLLSFILTRPSAVPKSKEI